MGVTFFDIETTGLRPFEDKIITVQVRRENRNTIWKEWELGEAETMESFFEFQRTLIRKEEIFVGYNILKFDLPFLDVRLRELGIMNNWKWQVLHRWLNWVDLYQLLGNAYFSLRTWAFKLLGEERKVQGKDIPRLYQQGEFEKITEYIENELQGMEQIYSSIQELPFYQELQRIREAPAKDVRKLLTKKPH